MSSRTSFLSPPTAPALGLLELLWNSMLLFALVISPAKRAWRVTEAYVSYRLSLSGVRSLVVGRHKMSIIITGCQIFSVRHMSDVRSQHSSHKHRICRLMKVKRFLQKKVNQNQENCQRMENRRHAGIEYVHACPLGWRLVLPFVAVCHRGGT